MNFKPHAFPSDGKRLSLGKMPCPVLTRGESRIPSAKAPPKQPPQLRSSCYGKAVSLQFLKQDAGLYLTQMAVKTVALTAPLSLMLLHGSHPPSFSDVWV